MLKRGLKVLYCYIVIQYDIDTRYIHTYLIINNGRILFSLGLAWLLGLFWPPYFFLIFRIFLLIFRACPGKRFMMNRVESSLWVIILLEMAYIHTTMMMVVVVYCKHCCICSTIYFLKGKILSQI